MKTNVNVVVAVGLLGLGFGCGGKGGGTDRPRDQPVLANDAPARPQADTEVLPPRASDLPRYLENIPGDGPLIATIVTTMGTIHCELAADRAPMTVANFVGLATGQKAWKDPRSGKTRVGEPFYDGLAFHRVIDDFMIQGGDPLGTGSGGPGYEFPNEVDPGLRHDRPGMLAMANAGADTNGSQFYILDAEQSHLDGGYSVFGTCRDVDVVSAIAAVPTTSGGKPVTPVIMQQVTISR